MADQGFDFTAWKRDLVNRLGCYAVADPGFDFRGGVDFVNGGGAVENH